MGEGCLKVGAGEVVKGKGRKVRTGRVVRIFNPLHESRPLLEKMVTLHDHGCTGGGHDFDLLFSEQVQSGKSMVEFGSGACGGKY